MVLYESQVYHAASVLLLYHHEVGTFTGFNEYVQNDCRTTTSSDDGVFALYLGVDGRLTPLRPEVLSFSCSFPLLSTIPYPFLKPR